jgi:pimeloyl-ACP methyl ester carboxylesterase
LSFARKFVSNHEHEDSMNDRTTSINPDLERMYAKRAHSHTVEIAGASHSVYESHPKDVAALIEQAAQHAQD